MSDDANGNLGGFDANTVEPNKFDVLPAGEYDVVIVNSEVKTTTAGDGRYLKLEIQVLNGPCQNRKLFDNLNLWNPNDQTQQIARGTLSSICRSVGVLTPKDSSELHNKPLRCKVVVKTSPEYGQQNAVKGYKSRNTGPATTLPSEPAAAAPWPTEAKSDTRTQAAERF